MVFCIYINENHIFTSILFIFLFVICTISNYIDAVRTRTMHFLDSPNPSPSLHLIPTFPKPPSLPVAHLHYVRVVHNFHTTHMLYCEISLTENISVPYCPNLPLSPCDEVHYICICGWSFIIHH